MDTPEKQKLQRQNSWQYLKYLKLYSDLLLALTAQRFLQRGPEYLLAHYPHPELH